MNRQTFRRIMAVLTIALPAAFLSAHYTGSTSKGILYGGVLAAFLLLGAFAPVMRQRTTR